MCTLSEIYKIATYNKGRMNKFEVRTPKKLFTNEDYLDLREITDREIVMIASEGTNDSIESPEKDKIGSIFSVDSNSSVSSRPSITPKNGSATKGNLTINMLDPIVVINNLTDKLEVIKA